jgi:2-alkyl-3-oxoalkanoate reductase
LEAGKPLRIVLTGGSSLIGRRIADLLDERGDVVVAFQRTRSPDLATRVTQVLGDITDIEAVDIAVAGADAVIHLAAKVGVVGPRSDYFDVNVNGTLNVLRAAQRVGVRRFVHVSSPSVAHDGTPIVGAGADPAITAHGSAWYSETKAIAEKSALDANSADMGVVVIRPHLVWGPGDVQLVGRIVERAAAGRLALVGGGRALVDTTYIDNAASALVAAVDAVHPDAVCAGRAYVIANGEPRPVRELVAGICAAARVEFEPRDVSLRVARRVGSVIDQLWPMLRRADEPPLTRFLADQLGTAHWFDPRPPRIDLSWSPTVTIEQGLSLLTDWFAASRTAVSHR